nr:hypothetical protein [Tanacetum cinerariifolium]
PSIVGQVAAVLTYLAVLVDAAALGELCLAVLTESSNPAKDRSGLGGTKFLMYGGGTAWYPSPALYLSFA